MKNPDNNKIGDINARNFTKGEDTIAERKDKERRDARIARRIGAAGVLIASVTGGISFLSVVGEGMGIPVAANTPTPVIQIVERGRQDPEQFW